MSVTTACHSSEQQALADHGQAQAAWRGIVAIHFAVQLDATFGEAVAGLLEEEGHAGGITAVLDVSGPLEIGLAVAVAGLSAEDHPVDASQVESMGQGTEGRLVRDEADGAV